MKIRKIEAVPIEVPLIKPMVMAGRTLTSMSSVLVRLETTGTHVGWGEAAAAPFLTGETVESILTAVSCLSEAVLDEDVRDVSALADLLQRAMAANSAAKAAVEMAAHDAAGRELGVPAYRLLGGQTGRKFPCLWLLGSGNAAHDIAEAKARATEGYRAFKLKVANGRLEEEAGTFVALRELLGHERLLAADANTGWTAREALRFAALVADAAPDFLEQPVAAEDVAALMRVARSGLVPIGADEAIHDISDVQHLVLSGAAAGVSIKIMKLAGVTRSLAACRLCAALGGEVNLSGKVGETSLANAATLTLATVFGRPGWGLSLTAHYLADDVVREPVTVEAGHVRPLKGNGLGVDIDELKVARLERWPSRLGESKSTPARGQSAPAAA
jgi:L-alanine-DL-glutamate epimerase-like enolase superfamily enzyme